MLDPKSPPVAEVVVLVGLAPKLKPPAAPVGCAVIVLVLAVVFVVLFELLALPPNEKPPEVPEKGLLAGGWEKENDADRPSVEPVDAAGVEPNMVVKGAEQNGETR